MFEDRYAWLRLTLLGLSGVGYLFLRHEPTDPYAPVDWAFAVAAIALCPVAVRWPLTGALASALGFALAANFGRADPVVPEVGATWVVLEVVLRTPLRRATVGVAGLVVAHFTDVLD